MAELFLPLVSELDSIAGSNRELEADLCRETDASGPTTAKKNHHLRIFLNGLYKLKSTKEAHIVI